MVQVLPAAGQSAMAPQQEQKETADQREEKIVEGLRTYSLEAELASGKDIVYHAI
jgi:hypothetical protein